MKKLLVSVLAIAGLVACSQDTTLVQNSNNGTLMEFNVAALDNATRVDPSITLETLDGFDVWAYVDTKEGTVLTEERVSLLNGAWSYVNKQYWTPGHNYYFTAIAPVEPNNWAYNQAEDTIAFTNVEGTEDLLLAEKTVVTPETLGESMPAVGLQFNHLLSKVRFTFKNTFATDNVYVVVKDVEMVVPGKGTYAITNETWTLGEGTTTLDFGDVVKLGMAESATAADERLTIPASEEYAVTFTIEHYNGEVLVGTYHKASSVTGVTFEKGKAYNFVAEINAENVSDTALLPIEFEVNGVTAWDETPADEELEVATAVSTAKDLQDAIDAGQNVVLTGDINLDELPVTTTATRAGNPYGLLVNKDVVIDGAGYTISTSAVRAILMKEGANVILKNFTLKATGERGIQMQGEGHNVTIENVVATSANYTVYLTGTSANSKVVVKDCDLTGLNTISVYGENHEVTVVNTKITTIDNADFEGYAPVYNVADNTTVYVNGGEVVITGEHAEDTVAGVIHGSANIVFNGTEGDCTVEGHKFGIYYDNGYNYTFSTFAEAYETAKDGETIVLLQNITIESHLTINKNVNLDLNGNTITVDVKGGSGDDAIWVRDNAESVISNGAIRFVNLVDATVYASGIFATGTSKVTLENMDVVAGAEAVFAQSSAAVEILSGSYKSIEFPGFTLNLKDSARATASIVVKGGKYFQFNPADNAAEGEHTNFVAAGKTVEQEGDWYVVK